jgi:aerobic carbon-monoxide dehydrogenase small subunit
VRLEATINGQALALEVEERTLLLEALRARGLTGAKLSCDMEVCGACTVLVDGLPHSACTTLAAEVEGRRVTTVEGLARGAKLTAVQRAFLECSAFQCGFCTPGMVLTATALLDERPDPTREEVIHWMDGSICRCTGYGSIVEAVLRAAELLRQER